MCINWYLMIELFQLLACLHHRINRSKSWNNLNKSNGENLNLIVSFARKDWSQPEVQSYREKINGNCNDKIHTNSYTYSGHWTGLSSRQCLHIYAHLTLRSIISAAHNENIQILQVLIGKCLQSTFKNYNTCHRGRIHTLSWRGTLINRSWICDCLFLKYGFVYTSSVSIYHGNLIFRTILLADIYNFFFHSTRYNVYRNMFSYIVKSFQKYHLRTIYFGSVLWPS